MAPSLKERYDERKLQQLQERARAAHAQVLAEQKTAQLILEAMDEKDIQKVSQIIQKLNTLKAPELPHLSAAIDQAQAELNKFTGGGPIAAAWSKMMTKIGIDNPVVKITTFADALERGFAQIPTILKNNGVDLAKADLKKSLASTLLKPGPTGAKSDKEMGKSPVTGQDVPDKEKIDTPKDRAGGTMGDQYTSATGAKVPDKDDNYSVPGPEGTKSGTKPTPAREPPPTKHTGGQNPPPKLAPNKGKKPTPYKGPGNAGPSGFSKSQEDWFDKGDKSKGANEGQQLDELDPIGWAKDKLKNKPPKEVSGEEKLSNITAQIRKALAPGGIFGAFKQIPYIKGDILTQELIKAPIQVFANVAKRAQQGTKAAELTDLKDKIQGQGDQQSKAPNTATPSQQSAQSQPGQPAKPTTATTDTTGTGEAPKAGAGQTRGGGSEVGDQRGQGNTAQKAQQFRAGLAKIYKGAGVDPDTGQKLMKYLISNKLMDRDAVEGHGGEAQSQKKTAAA